MNNSEPISAGEVRPMPDPQTAMPAPMHLSKISWPLLLPWLDEYRAGPPILADDELIPNAWLGASPAENLNAANFHRFCERVAMRHLEDRAEETLADDFPTVSPDSALTSLDIDHHIEKVLQGNNITTCGDVLSLSATRLSQLAHVSRATVAAIIAALVAAATRPTQGGGGPSGAKVLADPNLVDFVETLDASDLVILRERIVATHPSTQTELAQALGLSRERVNRRDRQLRLRLSDTVGKSVDLRRLRAEVIALADPVADVARIVQTLPLFATQIPALGISIGQLLVAGSDELTGVDDWIISCSPGRITDMVGEILDANTGEEALVPLRAIASGLHLPKAMPPGG